MIYTITINYPQVLYRIVHLPLWRYVRVARVYFSIPGEYRNHHIMLQLFAPPSPQRCQRHRQDWRPAEFKKMPITYDIFFVFSGTLRLAHGEE